MIRKVGVPYERVETGLIIPEDEPQLVQQHLREEVDINTIVRRFGLTQAAPPVVAGVYGDFTGVYDYESARELLDRIDGQFMQLPPEVRERFGNDPAQLLLLAEDEIDGVIPEPSPEAPEPPVE